MININHQQSASWKRLAPTGYNRAAPPVGIGESVVPVDLPRNQILLGDATERLRQLPSSSIDCVITSPPYWALRDYNAEGQIGLEASVDEWIDALRSVFAEVARVLKPGGGFWLNIGDTYSHHAKFGTPAKGMICAPERLLLALAGDGWIVRSKVIWSKTNTMPNSVTDRLNVTYEPIYFLVRSPRYFFDLNAIREPITPSAKQLAKAQLSDDGRALASALGDPDRPILGTNIGDVWRIATKGFRGPHFATFPPELVRRPILATCPEAICTKCGTPQKRKVSTWRVPLSDGSPQTYAPDGYVMRFGKLWNTLRQTGDLERCACNAPTVKGVVLDPFFGAGTVGLVAEVLGRDWIGIEISPEYRDLASNRLGRSDSLAGAGSGT